MDIKPTQFSAAMTGIWSVFGLVPFDQWMEHHKDIPTVTNNLLWIVAAAIFLIIPVYFFVFGSENEPFSRTWFLDKEERARRGLITKRMLVWFASAAIFGSLWSLLLGFVIYGKGF